jgi:hypothetical protein
VRCVVCACGLSSGLGALHRRLEDRVGRVARHCCALQLMAAAAAASSFVLSCTPCSCIRAVASRSVVLYSSLPCSSMAAIDVRFLCSVHGPAVSAQSKLSYMWPGIVSVWLNGAVCSGLRTRRNGLAVLYAAAHVKV